MFRLEVHNRKLQLSYRVIQSCNAFIVFLLFCKQLRSQFSNLVRFFRIAPRHLPVTLRTACAVQFLIALELLQLYLRVTLSEKKNSLEREPNLD